MTEQTDREMLELAAKAGGIELEWDDAELPGYYSDWRGLPQWNTWNPLADDGDRYRLLKTMNMKICFKDTFVRCGDVIVMWPDDEPTPERAIVRAAAEIGKAQA
jgi:hypothetical protein